VTPSRRQQFAFLGLVLPLAAFAASPAMAASSTPLHHKSHHAVHASHKVTPHHSTSVHHASHHTSHPTAHKTTVS
jgi:hypothetical protein